MNRSGWANCTRITLPVRFHAAIVAASKAGLQPIVEPALI
jgi:hypothetical protein